MKKRLLTAVVCSVIGATVGAAIALWRVNDYILGITIASAIVGFIFGLAFRIRAI